MKTHTKKYKHSRIKAKLYIAICIFLAAAILGIYTIALIFSGNGISLFQKNAVGSFSATTDLTGLDLSKYPKELAELLSRNPETLDFVKTYPDRDVLCRQTIDLTDDIASGNVPLFLQWDTRWGYNYYGDEFIAIAGCGPTCLSMAYVFLTGDTKMNPRIMSEWAYDNGYYSSSGTRWSLWTEGVNKLGLSGCELPLSENVMKNHLDDGGLIICSMSPGDFTTTGHIILIRGYDENGFYVNDPNSINRSKTKWSYTVLSKQIKGLWGISK